MPLGRLGNASRILQTYGADVEHLSWFWLAAPLTGMTEIKRRGASNRIETGDAPPEDEEFGSILTKPALAAVMLCGSTSPLNGKKAPVVNPKPFIFEYADATRSMFALLVSRSNP